MAVIETRVWGKVTESVLQRIRLLSLATGQSVGRIVGTAIQQLLEINQGEYERAIRNYLVDGTVAAPPGARPEDATCDIWGMVTAEQAQQLNLLALAAHIPRGSVAPFVELAIQEWLVDCRDEHLSLLDQLANQLAQQQHWTGSGGQEDA